VKKLLVLLLASQAVCAANWREEHKNRYKPKEIKIGKCYIHERNKVTHVIAIRNGGNRYGLKFGDYIYIVYRHSVQGDVIVSEQNKQIFFNYAKEEIDCKYKGFK
jgi:hypothetical protein